MDLGHVDLLFGLESVNVAGDAEVEVDIRDLIGSLPNASTA